MPTKAIIRRIGNSRGVILPASVLQEVGATDAMSLLVDNGRIILEPVQEPRKGWFENAADYQATQEEREWESAPLSDDSEWVW
jgi:antitoxin MazE